MRRRVDSHPWLFSWLEFGGPGPSGGSRYKVDLAKTRQLWAKASDSELHLCNPVPHASLLVQVNHNWDGFYTSPIGWARSLGFTAEIASRAAPLVSTDKPAPRNTVVVEDLQWPADGVHLSNLADCLALLSGWLAFARASLAASLRIRSTRALASRAALLRSGAIAAWSRKMRPYKPFQPYNPEFVLDSGVPRPPITVADHLLGARQEWVRVLQEPADGWSHPVVGRWVDSHGRGRGVLVWDEFGRLPRGDLRARVGHAYCSPGPVIVHQWQGSDVLVLSSVSVRVGSWVYRCEEGLWFAARPGPVSGRLFVLLQIDKSPASAWDIDRWYSVSTRSPAQCGFSVLRVAEPGCQACVGPLTLQERSDVIRRLRGSKPGPSGWKLEFLSLFPSWVQEIYWSMLDLQGGVGPVAPSLKTALQVHLPKPDGGWRPLTMLEEGFKAIEGPVTRRLNSQPFFSNSNLAFRPGAPAAAEVLHLDVLLCEDARAHNLPFCRIPADYEKFFNTIQLSSVDAIHHCRGVPDAARRLYQHAFHDVQVCVSTGVGTTDPIAVTRGCPQGAVSSPALSSAAQDPVLRLREHSQAAYRTSAGRSVACVGYADDVEHYGSGLVDLPVILAELSAGSVATGIGFSWRKFWAYASDWDQALPHLPPDASAVVFVNGANVQSWDIWAGGVRQAFLPRGDHARIDRLLGKRGVLFDRHSLPAEDLLSKFAAARRRLSAKHCSWDECLALYQWVMRGAASYVPLVGIPAPVSLHEEDVCFQRLLLSALGVRSTAERVSLLAASHIGGLGAPSVVETLVASCASDLITLLSGSSTASLVARDSLRHALLLPPQQAEDWDGLVVRGMRFLSGYGFHITVSTDRFVGRVLDLLAAHSAHPHALLGPFDPAVFPLRSGFVEWGWWPTRCAPFLRNSVALLSPLVPGGMLRNGPRTFQLIAGLLLLILRVPPGQL